MGTLEEFDPTCAAQQWISLKDRRQCSTPKATQQEWFSGVFPNAEQVQRKKNQGKITF